MFKTIVKHLFLLALCIVFSATRVFGQAINIGTLNTGPYAPGSTITVPFHIDNTGGSIGQNNTFSLYLSDVGGVTFSQPAVATLVSFYGNFLNYTLPAGLTPGTYKFKVTASNPVLTTTLSNSITVVAGTHPTAGTSTNPSITSEVFGRCTGTQTAPYFFTNTSTNATSVSVSFFDESGTTSVQVGTAQDITSSDYPFTAAAKNYRVTITATDASGHISTRSYQLINNAANTSLGSSGSNIACIDPVTNKAIFTFKIDYQTSTGIQFNYPGNLYTITWGDGFISTYTLDEIIAASGFVTREYTTVSCGQIGSNATLNNRFRVDLNMSNLYCGPTGSTSTGYATILAKPVNGIGNPTIATSTNICTGSGVNLTNLSIPGPDASATSTDCIDNPNARYTWLINGASVPGYSNVLRSVNFVHTFSTHGNYTITLRDVSGNGQCFADDLNFTVCVQDKSIADFTVPIGSICKTTTFTPTNTTTVDPTGCAPTTYTWSVSPATYTIVGNLTDAAPQFTFTAPDIYTIQLQATSICGTTTQTKTIIVEDTPTAALHSDLALCNPQPLSFDATNVQTGVAFTGTPTAGATNYTWDVTSTGNWHFDVGYTLHSQYPKIVFDDYATYTVTVTHTNSCGTSSDSQNITFSPAPVPYAGPPQTICEGSGAVHLNGSVTGGTYNSVQWSIIGVGLGGLSNNGTLTPDYTPNAAAFAAGSVTLRMTVTTNLPTPCDVNYSDVVITLIPTTIINSASASICSGSQLNYTITTNNDGLTPAPTFAWTASVTSGTATGFTASGTAKTISDFLTNSNPAVTAVVTYHIIPTTNGCAGTPFDYVVTIPAVPVVTPARAAANICSGSPTGITMASNLGSANTQYTWTVSAPVGITGASAQSSLTSTAAIPDVLINTTSGTLTVTYTITPYNNAGCPGTPASISVDVLPAPTVADALYAETPVTNYKPMQPEQEKMENGQPYQV